MYCVQCGSKVKDGSKFCTECGAPMPAPKAAYPPKTPEAPAAQNPQQSAASRPAAQTTGQPSASRPVVQQPVQAPVQPVSVQKPAPSKYKGLLICAILLTVFAYLTSNIIALGIAIIAIVQASKAKKKEAAGLEKEALAAAKTAKALNITAIVLEVIWIIALIVALVVLIRAGIQTAGMMSNQTPEAIQEFLRQYGYEYDIDLIREYVRSIEQNGAFLLGF